MLANGGLAWLRRSSAGTVEFELVIEGGNFYMALRFHLTK